LSAAKKEKVIPKATKRITGKFWSEGVNGKRGGSVLYNAYPDWQENFSGVLVIFRMKKRAENAEERRKRQEFQKRGRGVRALDETTCGPKRKLQKIQEERKSTKKKPNKKKKKTDFPPRTGREINNGEGRGSEK